MSIQGAHGDTAQAVADFLSAIERLDQLGDAEFAEALADPVPGLVVPVRTTPCQVVQP